MPWWTSWTPGPPSCRAYSLRACMVLSFDLPYFISFLFLFTSSVAFRFLSFSTCLECFSVDALNTGLASFPVALSQTTVPHSGPRLCPRPAPAHLPSHDPHWLLLHCLPPSNFARIFIQHSARLVVKLPACVHVWDRQLFTYVYLLISYPVVDLLLLSTFQPIVVHPRSTRDSNQHDQQSLMIELPLYSPHQEHPPKFQSPVLRYCWQNPR